MTKEEFLKSFSDLDKLNIADWLLEYFYDTHYPDMAKRVNALEQKLSSDPMYRELCSSVCKIKQQPWL